MYYLIQYVNRAGIKTEILVEANNPDQAITDSKIPSEQIDDVMSSTSLRDLPETIPIAVGLIGVFILAWAFRQEVATEVLDLGFALGHRYPSGSLCNSFWWG